MALPAYMSIEGQVQKLITENASTQLSAGAGAIDEETLNNYVLVQAFSHEVTKPFDPQSGMPTGLRAHKAVIVTKGFDKSSPLLQQALCTAEPLKSVVIKWYRNFEGNNQHYYTTTLEGARIVQIKDYMHNCQDPANAHFTHMEDVHFTYRKITWTHETSGTSGSDEWGKQKTD